MRHIALAIAVFAAAPAIAQPRVDWSQPVTGVDAPARAEADVTQTLVIISHSYKNPVTPIAIDPSAATADTPLPPPCEAPTPRSPPQQPGPPAPAPCPTPR